MAWRCSGASNSQLVNNLLSAELLSTPRIIQAFRAVDRAHFCPTLPYQDSPQYIGHGATISAPHMHAHALENLGPFLKPGSHVLDIGSGSGYLLAIMHELVGPSGTVLGIDHIDDLVQQSQNNLCKSRKTAAALEQGQIKVVCGDGRAGASHHDLPQGGFDAIHVGAAAPEIPQVLIDQLKSPGRCFIPVGTVRQAVYQIDKDAQGHFTKKELFGVNYVPLTDASAQNSIAGFNF